MNGIFSLGQDISKREEKENPFALLETTFSKKKVGKPFLYDTTFLSLEGQQINFANLSKNTFLYFGMYGCHPCMQELPALIELAVEHPDITFIYASHDSKKIIELERNEILGKGFKLPLNFYTLSLDRSFMDKNELIVGYPSRYFLIENGKVNFFNFGGRVFNSDITAQKKAMLSMIIETYHK